MRDQSIRSTFRSRVGYYLLRLALVSCAVILAENNTSAQVLGRPNRTWHGTWTSPAKGHQGTLRMHLRPTASGSYQGLFAGRFFVVIPYVFRAQVNEINGQLVTNKRLGPLGDYQMVLTPYGNSLQGYWSAAGQSGGIYMQPRR
ncbi:MAG: hypothetical protein KDB03_04855 [Planctomycetales bacterium]|nr:hypothetical protein [Planctomycetales bacterium]